MGRHDLSKITEKETVFPVWPSPWTNISEITWRNFAPDADMQAAYTPGNYTIFRDSTFTSVSENSTEFLHVKAPIAALNSSTLYLDIDITTPSKEGDTLALVPTDIPGSPSILQQLKDAG
ncbi:hypothetical protein B0T21DRAFT_414514 [Apiosordaria backusii]|uniref:Uncharacterized protein n=1 Tax=Apiosordaria backusii TaxID=314023 RepID=A0AA40ASS4_9PEZI|nr:hypothetical protein B0T21DRAFT_414514 [Apiosordaria backusii]